MGRESSENPHPSLEAIPSIVTGHQRCTNQECCNASALPEYVVSDFREVSLG